MDTDPTRDDWARRQALAEVLLDVIGLRQFLSTALIEDCSVVLD